MGQHSCCNKQKVKRGLWSPDEDEKLVSYITAYGHGCWSSVPRFAGLQRCGKSCRLRWINYLRPDLKRGSFTPHEAALVIELHRLLGNRWAQIAKHLPGRTDNEVKNFWNSSIKKKLVAHQNLRPHDNEYDPSAAAAATFSEVNMNPNNNPINPNSEPVFCPLIPPPPAIHVQETPADGITFHHRTLFNEQPSLVPLLLNPHASDLPLIPWLPPPSANRFHIFDQTGQLQQDHALHNIQDEADADDTLGGFYHQNPMQVLLDHDNFFTANQEPKSLTLNQLDSSSLPVFHKHNIERGTGNVALGAEGKILEFEERGMNATPHLMAVFKSSATSPPAASLLPLTLVNPSSCTFSPSWDP